VLEEIINLTDKWWSNVGQKEVLTIILAAGAPGPGAPIVVRIFPMRQKLWYLYSNIM
jgi:hypothetical protein